MEVAPPCWTLQELTTEYFDDALELFLDTFTNREPLGCALGESRDDLSDTYPREQMLSLLQHPFSVVAVTTGATNKVVGVYFARMESSPLRLEPVAVSGRLALGMLWSIP